MQQIKNVPHSNIAVANSIKKKVCDKTEKEQKQKEGKDGDKANDRGCVKCNK